VPKNIVAIKFELLDPEVVEQAGSTFVEIVPATLIRVMIWTRQAFQAATTFSLLGVIV
jgi:hypothetical protein